MYNNVKCTPKRIASSMLGKPYLLAKTSLRTTDWGKEFHFLDNLPDEPPTISINTLEKDIYQVPNVFTAEQCKEMISKANGLNFQFCCYGEKRNNSRLFDKVFAKYLWNVISEPLKNVLGDEKICPFGFDVTRGEWSLSGINEAMRLNRYSGKHKEHFGPHRDAPFCPNGDKRSLYTVLIYLNDDFLGGETRFLTPKDSTIDTKGCNVQEEITKHGSIRSGYDCCTYRPKTGDMVIFKQNLLHEGLQLKRPKNKNYYKYVIKTDVMVERPVDGMLGFAPSPCEQQDYFKCLQLFRQAQQLELDYIELDKKRVNDCYERSLSYRYFYPGLLSETGSDGVDDIVTRTNIETEGSKKDLTKSTEKIPRRPTHKECNPFAIFSHEIWYRIICYLQNHNSLRSLCNVFPGLRLEIKAAFT